MIKKIFLCLFLVFCIFWGMENSLTSVLYAQKEEAPGDTVVSPGGDVIQGTEITLTDRKALLEQFPGFGKTISVDLRSMAIVDALKFLAFEGDLNIITAKGLEGNVNLLVEDVKIIDAFEILLAANDLAYYTSGNIITVMQNERYKVLKGEDFYDIRETYVYQLKYASAAKIGALLGNIKSTIGKVVYDDATGIIILTDTPEKIQEMKKIIAKSDISTITRELPLETESFELKYAKVEDIKEEVSAALTPNVGSIRTDIRTNSFVISDLPHNMKKIKKIIQTFDRKTREVFIEAKIVQVTLSETFKWGIDWDKVFAEVGGKTNLTLTPEVTMPSSLSTFGKLTIAKTGSKSLNMVLEMLQSEGETKILSNPHIATEEGKEATINVITKQPYSETTTTTTDAATTESTEYTFADVGVKLNVTPTVNLDGFISMLIKPEVSSITSFYPDSTSENRVPVIETANAETTVLIKDGTTIIIAGMIKDTKTKSSNKVPLLGDIPVMGKLFSNVSDDIRRTETVVFLTPSIISGEDSYLLDRDKEKQIKGLRQ